MNVFRKSPSRIAAVAALATVLCGSAANAQAQIEGEAFADGAFGVGRVEIVLPRRSVPEPLGVAGILLTEADGRVLYPVVTERPIGGLVRDLIGVRAKATVTFLFPGDGPLELTLLSREKQHFTLVPKHDPDERRRAIRAWWQEYSGYDKALPADADVLMVENYLTAMLSRRLGMPLPEEQVEESWEERLAEELGLAANTDRVRRGLVRDRMLGLAPLDQPADQPLPEPVAVEPLDLPPADGEVAIEPIAGRVPVECFYIRFGSFANYIWVQDTLGRLQRDVQTILGSGGLDPHVRQRMEEQLVLSLSLLGRVAGGTVVEDVALVGTDLFFQDGGAYGILFRARLGNPVLGVDILRQRAQRLAKNDGVTEEKVTIAGHEVSVLTSPDGKVRSFYVADGGHHFVTTSRTLVRRFLETAGGSGSLGSSDEFRHARNLMPTSRDDTVFVYLSDAFLQHFTGPAYRIEAVRRMQALADLELLELAGLAASGEGKPCGSIEDLIAGGFLPEGFGPRPDGSRAVLGEDGAYDSLRGHRGAFTPIPDIEIDRVTSTGAGAYRQFGEFYRENWKRLDPILAGVKRHGLPEGRERVVVDLRMSPLGSAEYDLFQQLVGSPSLQRLAPVEGDVASLEVVFPDAMRFAGLRDTEPEPKSPWLQLVPGSRWLDLFRGYVGSTGELGFLGLLDRLIERPADEGGYAEGRYGLWRRTAEGFTLFSLQRDVLEEITPQLRLEDADRPAQARLRVGDVSDSRLSGLLDSLGYERGRQATLENLRLVHALRSQLGVPGEECRPTAERLLNAELVCPLGGEYQYEVSPGGVGAWTSTALGSGRRRLLSGTAPSGYEAPIVRWLRGLDAEARLEPRTLSVHADLAIEGSP